MRSAWTRIFEDAPRAFSVLLKSCLSASKALGSGNNFWAVSTSFHGFEAAFHGALMKANRFFESSGFTTRVTPAGCWWFHHISAFIRSGGTCACRWVGKPFSKCTEPSNFFI
jgi:hypothetical protein